MTSEHATTSSSFFAMADRSWGETSTGGGAGLTLPLLLLPLLLLLILI